MMKKQTLVIEGMTCGGCANKVKGALEGLGVKIEGINVSKRTVDVEYDESEVSFAKIQETIEQKGYKAS